LGRVDAGRVGASRGLDSVDRRSPVDMERSSDRRRTERRPWFPSAASALGGATRISAAPAISFILDEDPELAQGLSPEDRSVASDLFRAEVIDVTRPRWQPPELEPTTTYGLLVLDGLMGRRVRVGSAVATELLGSGDILRPWDEPTLWDMIPPELDWRVFRPSRLAVLDERITALIGRRRELVVTFSGRLLRRARSIAYLTAISHLTRVESKLIATLWHIASSWGRVTPEGVSVPFRLTHEVLGEILGAQRPSVTIAMQRLQQREQVRRIQGGGYLLIGDPAAWNRWAEAESSPD
jgi:CRP/FNR family transcriptional regulator, cyclic AMP receptor protein